jgi:hypothetical protein
MSEKLNPVVYKIDATKKVDDCYGFRIEGDYLGQDILDGYYLIFDATASVKRGDLVAVTSMFASGTANRAQFAIGRLVEDIRYQSESERSFLRGEKGSVRTFEIKQFNRPDFAIPVEGLLGVHKCVGIQRDFELKLEVNADASA